MKKKQFVKDYFNDLIDENEKQNEYYNVNDNLKYYNIQKNNYNEKKKKISSISRLSANFYHVVVVVEKHFHLTMIYIVTFELIVKNYQHELMKTSSLLLLQNKFTQSKFFSSIINHKSFDSLLTRRRILIRITNFEIETTSKSRFRCLSKSHLTMFILILMSTCR